jgi:hypothetical protein
VAQGWDYEQGKKFGPHAGQPGTGVGVHFFNKSEMALFSECLLMCARNLFDTADIVRGAC